MEIGILNILDKKDISAERIVLQVREDCNSWAFILFCNTSKDEGCSTYSGAYPFTFRQLIRV